MGVVFGEQSALSLNKNSMCLMVLDAPVMVRSPAFKVKPFVKTSLIKRSGFKFDGDLVVKSALALWLKHTSQITPTLKIHFIETII